MYSEESLKELHRIKYRYVMEHLVNRAEYANKMIWRHRRQRELIQALNILSLKK